MIERLQRELTERGLAVRVEARGRLAVLLAGRAVDELMEERVRKGIVDLALGSGFTHVAVELEPQGRDL
ncbi:MAG: hypothetical protein ACT4R6_07345 [Gemmatimonadaceae bacterium]